MTWSNGMEKHIDLGFKFLLGGIDGAILYDGVKNLVNEFNQFAKEKA